MKNVWLHRQYGLMAPTAVIAFLGVAHHASAQFSTFEGGAAAETAWRAAAGGSVPSEDFESFNAVPSPFSGPSDQIQALPALGIVFASNVHGAFPGVYTNAGQAHSGTKQLANFGGGLGAFSTYRIHPEAGKAIYALGFWQCDPQGNQTMIAYDASNNVVGEITGLINNGTGNSFAGFVSTVPIARIDVDGFLGDGWNHIDDLQVVSRGNCAADFDGDGTVDFFDYLDFVDAFSSNLPAADFNNDATIDFFDYLDFVDAFSSGC